MTRATPATAAPHTDSDGDSIEDAWTLPDDAGNDADKTGSARATGSCRR
jgi:hypothetical protein